MLGTCFLCYKFLFTMARKRNIISSMNTTCRTCGFNGNSESNFSELKKHIRISASNEIHDLTLWDLLFELAQIGPDMEDGDKLPQHVCESCDKNIQMAYDFVLQVRETNKKLLSCLKSSDNDSHSVITDCLLEKPMQTNDEEIVEVKIEVDTDIPGQSSLKEPQSELNLIQKTTDPLTVPSAKTKWLHDFINSSSDEDYDDVPLSERKIRNQVHSVINSTTSRSKCTMQQAQHTYKCDKCSKTYLRPKNLLAHLESHTERSKPMRSTNLCERRKVEELDINLCKPNGCKLIQCMICLRKFNKFVELRNHFSAHSMNLCFDELQGSLQDIADSFYTDTKHITEKILIDRISKDLQSGHFSRFYSITNESGYELSLDSSETDSDDELETANPKNTNNYFCEICKDNYRRKYQLLEHQLQKHSWLSVHNKCGRCDARFVSKDLLAHHQKTLCKNTQKRFLCNKCPQRFRWKHNYQAHNREHRNKKQTLSCSECDRTYDDKKSLTIHMLTIHTDKSQLMPCHWCNRKFYRKDYFYKHIKRHGLQEKDLPLAETFISATSRCNGNKNIQCKVCNKHFQKIWELRQHLLNEIKMSISPHKNYESMSNYSITNDAGYELHIEDSETDNESLLTTNALTTYTCDLCQVQCRRKFEIMQHQRAMHRLETLPYACEKCIFKSVSKKVVEYHKRTQCLNEEKKFECSKCNYKFMWSTNLDAHMRLQHFDEAQMDVITTKEDTSKNMKIPESNNQLSITTPKLLQCPHCDRTYLLQSFLNNHIRDVHAAGSCKKKENKRKYLCALCGLEAQTSSNLVIHMRRHTGEKPFKCDNCNMGFIRHSELIIHKRQHTGERPYQCTVCSKDFTRSDKLKRHMLTHSGLKPFKCTYCEKTYRYSKDLKLHLLQHTGETPFECGTCGDRFMQNTALEKHRMMRRHFDETK